MVTKTSFSADIETMKVWLFLPFLCLALVAALFAKPLVPAVHVAGGTFLQGLRTLDPPDPGRSVTVSSFWMGTTEVTQQQYQALTNANPSWFKGPLKPVESVSWFDAVAFCNLLSDHDGLRHAYAIEDGRVSWDPTSPGWRLPTEAEWEFAARGGTHPWRKDFPGNDAVEEVAWDYYNSSKQTHNVGALKPNELGLFDLAGNVWEWCWDWYEFDRSDLPPKDPRGPLVGSSRVSRGGAWNEDHTDAFRPYYRADDGPETKGNNLGFRVVRNDQTTP